ncbi:hypothetical protein EK21DRAFT_58909 [Setomelanomma holmii]|uniref:Uncharacterized protein n=1 Tax=Setomelanomma holmii TaxID=210430 RepID=A0A9P4HED5_9PLEO|nr:hypothetical protein EK21DRAFT_58909 [Setomelanomma holmii]
MALRSCAWNIELFLPDTLQWAGWHFASRVYQHLLNIEALTYNAWDIFHDAFPNEIKHQHDFHVYQQDELSTEPTQLFSIVNRLSKLNSSLTTYLCIRDFSLTFDHLKALISVPTLTGLVLEQSRRGGLSALSERDFTNWCRAVKERDALCKLELLVMCDFGLGKRVILLGLSALPSLKLVGFQNSKTWFMSDEPPREYGVLEKRGLSDYAFDPQAIWGASYLTSSTKIQRLHDLTEHLASKSSRQDQDARSVSITYGGWASRSIHEATSWFIRTLSTSHTDTILSENISVQSRNPGTANKKRKVRPGKRLDMESLLGGFT